MKYILLILLTSQIYAITPAVSEYCKKIDKTFQRYKWGESHCSETRWNHVRNSVIGTPLIWTVFGDEKRLKKDSNRNVTLFICGVHGDEITPVKFCFDLIEDIKKNPQLIKENTLVAIAPIANPDSFFKKKPTRTNANGVDINRNLPTKDWAKNAHRLWRKRYKKDKRRYPGRYAMSEPETLFKVNLMLRYKPTKVLSVHAPLTLLDYDGPEQGKNEKGKVAHELLIQMSEKAKQYKVKNYPFFTGSLGNWAGNERNIPTYTIELPNSDWTKTKRFYKRLRTAVHTAITNGLVSKSKREISTKPHSH